MDSSTENNSSRKKPEIIITNKVISFWYQVLQISNICDIGKFEEVKNYKFHLWQLYLAGFLGVFFCAYLILSLQKFYILIIFICFSPLAYLFLRFTQERRSSKNFYFRIRMNGGQQHTISSDSEQFIDKLIETTVAAMENHERPITFVGNIDNSTVVQNSNVAINSQVRSSFNG